MVHSNNATAAGSFVLVCGCHCRVELTNNNH